MKNFTDRVFLMLKSSNGRSRFCGIDVDYLGCGEGKIALDFGCGNGHITLELLRRGFDVVAFDIVSHEEPRMRAKLAKNENDKLIFCHNNISALMNYKDRVDLIICRETLEHVQDRENLISLFKELLNDKGVLVVSVPTEMSEKFFLALDEQWLKKSEHTEILNDKYLHQLFDSQGFQVTNKTVDGFKWFVFWLLLAPFKTDHKMGNPSANNFLVRFALKVVRCIEKYSFMESIGNLFFPKSTYYYLEHAKRSILCVYDYEDWILGTWAKNIRIIYQNKFNFFNLSMDECFSNKKNVKKLVEKVDAVFLLLPHPYEFFRQLNPAILICAIHHWVEFSKFYADPIKHSDFIVTGANQWREAILDKNRSANVCVVYSGYDEKFFISDAPKSFFINNKVVLGFFSKYSSNENDRKGVRHLLKIIKLLYLKNIVSNYSIVLTGDGWESVVEELQGFGIDVLYYGRVPSEEMPSIYDKIDFYLMLSDVEGGPATISESFASGCVTITTPIGISLDIIQDKINGFFVDAADTEEIIVLFEYLRCNPLICSNISENAKQFAKQHLSYKETFKPLGYFLDQAVSTIVRNKDFYLAQKLYKNIVKKPS